jgi:hypothetical protein
MSEPTPNDAPRPARRRPAWVYAVFLAYIVLAALVTFGPLLFVVGFESASRKDVLITAVYALVVFGCGVSLVIVPIGQVWDLPDEQRPIVVPLVGSATLAAGLFFGFAWASHEYIFGDETGEARRAAGRAIWVALPFVWLAWLVAFGVMSDSADRDRLNRRLSRTLLAGSVLELLVAIPMHLVVRGRGYCCAGMMTGIGVGVGITVMVVALGPAVIVLFYRRYQQVYARRPKPGDGA